jgi:membrane associated rhomboid family serine protease
MYQWEEWVGFDTPKGHCAPPEISLGQLRPDLAERLHLLPAADPVSRCFKPIYSHLRLHPARLSAALGGGEVEVTNVTLTIFTAMFMHGGWLHLLGNMLFLWIFGDNVEDALGHFTYLISYLAFGVAATLTHFLIDPFGSLPALGASGVIAGVLGFYLILYPGARVLSLIPIFVFFWLVRVPAAIFLFVWFIFQTFGGVATVGQQVGGGVAYWAHIGGFLAGVGIGVLFRISEQAVARRHL